MVQAQLRDTTEQSFQLQRAAVSAFDADILGSRGQPEVLDNTPQLEEHQGCSVTPGESS